MIFSGAPGTGKSTLSYRLSKKKRWVLLSKDTIDRGLEKENILSGSASYQIILDLCKLNLNNGINVIIDACMSTSSIKKQLIKIGNTSKIFVIECICSDESYWQKTIETRSVMVEGWTPVDFFEAKRVKEKFSDWGIDHLVLDSVAPLEKNFAKLLKFLES